MAENYSVDALVPHAGTMSLLTRIAAYGDEWLEAEVDIHAGSTFAETNGVPAWVGMEYMAQAVAAFAGLQEKRQNQPPKIGFLLGSRRYAVNTDWFNTGQTLLVRVERDMIADNGLHVFNCTISAHHVSAQASLNVFQPDDAGQFLKEAIL